MRVLEVSPQYITPPIRSKHATHLVPEKSGLVLYTVSKNSYSAFQQAEVMRATNSYGVEAYDEYQIINPTDSAITVVEIIGE